MQHRPSHVSILRYSEDKVITAIKVLSVGQTIGKPMGSVCIPTVLFYTITFIQIIQII